MKHFTSIGLFLVSLSLLIILSQSAISGNDENNKDKIIEKPRNVIFLIGDGMGLTQITAGMYSSPNSLALEVFKMIGLIKTHSSDNLITDSAAGATAFSTGTKTYNGAIAVDMQKKPLKTIMEMAGKKGIATGIVATSTITHATPACFYAHQPSRKMEEAIASDLSKSKVNIAIGGGRAYFNDRADGQNLLETFRDRGYTVVDSMTAQTEISDKMLAFIGSESPKKVSEGRGDILTIASAKVAHKLAENKKGFFLLIEGSQIDWGGHANDSEYIISEMIDFDNTIRAILEFAKADGNTLVVVTADHETGGYAINGGNVENRTIEAGFTTGYHTGTMVPVFAFGPGAGQFTGIYENTAIFDKLKSLLNL